MTQLVLSLAVLFLISAVPIHADPLEIDKTDRMAEIETKYHMRMAGILRTPGEKDCWVFMIAEPETTFSNYPVVVSKDCSDHDVAVAIIAASHCAVFYEANLKGDKPTPSPTPEPRPSSTPRRTDNSAFTPPTHPPTHVHV